MATFTIYYDKKRLFEGKEVKALVRVTQNQKHAYAETGIYLSRSQVDKDLEIKDDDLYTTLLQIRRKYKKWVEEEIGEDVASYKATDIKAFIDRKLKGDDVDFFEYAESFLKKMEKNGRKATAMPIRKSINGFKDFLKKEHIGCNCITLELLQNFGAYLKKDRKITRKDQFGIDRERVLKPLDDFGVSRYYLNLQGVFNAARKEYNDEDAGIYTIKRNPFKKLEIKVKKTDGSHRSAEIEIISKILNMEDTPFHRVNMARDAFLLSFMLVGMPPVDLYNVNEYKDGRISYNRTKTKDKREDGAFFSVKVYPEVEKLIEKYRDPSGERVFNFHKIYSDPRIFYANMNKGLKKVQEICGIDHHLTMYVARHTFASTLRNTLKVPKSDVSECLNHSVGNTVTDYYIKRDFSHIDDLNRRLLNYLFEIEKETNSKSKKKVKQRLETV